MHDQSPVNLLRAVSSCAVILCLFGGVALQPARAKELLSNPGFEATDNGTATGWRPFEEGYELSRDIRRSGSYAIRCTNPDANSRRGATATITLNQTRARPIIVEGYSRAEAVSGFMNNDYSIYLDIIYMDGTPLWGQTAPFSTGTHDWERKQVLVWPAKPIREVYVHALFRHHSGTVWFDDFSARELDPLETFDGQRLTAPRLPANVPSGWFVRDVAAGSPIVSAREASGRLGIEVRPLRPSPKNWHSVRVQDLRGTERCVSVYYVERVKGTPQWWWQDMRRRIPVRTDGEYANLTRLGVGATGSQSLYPLACITSSQGSVAWGVPPEQGAVVVRLGFHAPSRLLYAVFDVALCPDNEANSAGGRGFATLNVLSWPIASEWGFRAALAGYYARFPQHFKRRALAEGIWIPFTDPATVENVADFGIAYHEGDNSVESDDRLGILSFRYTEPMTWWMPMDPQVPRTYEAALSIAEAHRGSDRPWERGQAQALWHSGTYAPDGRFNVEFQNAPWTNGAVWVLNPNPRLPAPPGEATKATLAFGPEVVRSLYERQGGGVLDGEYLDSLEGWADVLDYRPESRRYSSVPVTFETHGFRPVVPTWFSVYELTRYMSAELRRRGKLLMANATPWRLHVFAPFLDVMGTETNWLPGGHWRPDPDEIFCLRQALSYRKPYLLLQNTDFDRFDSTYVERYMKRCLFYAVYPSMFSLDASTRNYWTQPQWYNRDRHLFRRYVPLIATLSKAGWEPITGARTSDAKVYVERYGSDYLTVFNDSDRPRSVTLDILSSSVAPGRSLERVTEVLAGRQVPLKRMASGSGAPRIENWRVSLTLGAEEVLLLRLHWLPKPSPKRSSP